MKVGAQVNQLLLDEMPRPAGGYLGREQALEMGDVLLFDETLHLQAMPAEPIG